METELSIAQISDCHLFSETHGLHCGANVFENLCSVLLDIKTNKIVDAIIFTGDLTQDHSVQSYQNFVSAVKLTNVEVPVYFIPGNHDEIELLDKYLVGSPFSRDKIIESENWQILLLNSKSETPAGEFRLSEFIKLTDQCEPVKSQFSFMHHHPIDVNYFIDRHGLTNKTEFWLAINKNGNMKGIACGHVHQGLNILPLDSSQKVPLHTCPATSIQFDPLFDGVKALKNVGAGYRTFKFMKEGRYTTELSYL